MSVPSGLVYLCNNAIVDRTYTHTIDFKTPSEQFTYWGSLVKYGISDFTYIRRQTQYIRVNKNLDELQDVNYLYYRAKENSKYYFCFVTNKEYINENSSYVYFETDVLQTYMFDYEVKQSYVLQEHCDRWDANHKPIYSRTEENLDYGSEYTVEKAYKIQPTEHPITSISRHYNPIRWYIAICVEHDVVIDGGDSSKNNTEINFQANPFTLYLLPSLDNVNFFTFTKSNGEVQSGIGGIRHFINEMANGHVVVGAGDVETEVGGLGNYVKQIIKLPYLPFDVDVETSRIVDRSNGDLTITQMGNYYYIKIKKMILKPKDLAEMDIFNGIENVLPTSEQWEEVVTNPYTTERDKRFESKLLTHPYRYNLLTDWKSQPVIIKNEYIGSDKIKVKFVSGIGFNNAVRYWIDEYKKDPQGRNSSLTQLVPEEQPVINDAYYTYMLENKNQIQANQTNAIINSVSNVAQNLVGGAIFGGGMGAVSGAVGGAITGAINYQNMIRSENAKQKDLKNYPDSIINSNDGLFNVIDNNEFLTFYRMKICCEFEEQLADTFATSGYTVKRIKIPNLKTRARYNYVKTVGANIVGSFDQNDLTTIKQIFDNGITFWHYNTVNFKPFDYSLENIETKLLNDNYTSDEDNIPVYPPPTQDFID